MDTPALADLTALREFLFTELFLQHVWLADKRDVGIAGTFVEAHSLSDAHVALVNDYWCGRQDESVSADFAFIRQAGIPRVLVTEVLGDRDFVHYGRIAEKHGFRLHRCIFIKSGDVDIAAMDIHRKD